MNSRVWGVLIGIACGPAAVAVAAEPKAPSTVGELFADVDPRKDPLDAKVLREWEESGIVYRYITYHAGTFKGKPSPTDSRSRWTSSPPSVKSPG